MLNQKLKANSSNPCQNSLDVLHRLNAIDLTEDQMEAYSGGNAKGVIFWFSTSSGSRNMRYRFPSDGPGRGGTVTASLQLLTNELTHVVQ